jgi:hypothetical protein
VYYSVVTLRTYVRVPFYILFVFFESLNHLFCCSRTDNTSTKRNQLLLLLILFIIIIIIFRSAVFYRSYVIVSVEHYVFGKWIIKNKKKKMSKTVLIQVWWYFFKFILIPKSYTFKYDQQGLSRYYVKIYDFILF